MVRNYQNAHVAMLQSGNELTTNALPRVAELSKKSTEITEAWLNGIRSRIDNGFNILGFNNYADVKQNRYDINTQADVFTEEIKEFLSAIDFNFRNNPQRLDAMYVQLEFTRFKKPYGKIALMEIAANIAQNFGGFESEIRASGVPAAAVESIKIVATDYIVAFKGQSQNKGRASVVTEEQQIFLNEIFADIMALSAVGQSTFRADMRISRLFSYYYIVKKYTKSRSRAKQTDVITDQNIAPETPDTNFDTDDTTPLNYE